MKKLVTVLLIGMCLLVINTTNAQVQLVTLPSPPGFPIVLDLDLEV